MPALRNFSFLLLLALLTRFCPCLAAQQIVTRTLVASLDTGSLAGTKFAVSFSYDAGEVSSQGESYVALQSLNFTLHGVAFSKSDIFQGGQAIFRSGMLKNVTASFQVRLPANSPVNNITFGFGGDGVIGYVDLLNTYGGGSFAFTAAAAVVNSASFAAAAGALAPGGLATITGAGLAPAPAQATGPGLPLLLNTVAVSVGSLPAPIQYVSPDQINFQVPWEALSGNTSVTVSLNGIAAPQLPVTITTVAPGIFTVPFGSTQAAAVNLDGALVAPEGSVVGVTAHPAKPGDTIAIFATGLGAVTPPLGDGQIPSDALRFTVLGPQVLIGGIPAQVEFSGLSPQFPGVDQINVVVPQTQPGIVRLRIEIAGAMSNEVTIAVGPIVQP